ncbi:glycosyltransferase [Vibrio sp.]|uniref:glycosyltransferase n=1 Tax=Vibrio sp. TaxID=678 RepID=UPI003F6B46BD
MKCFINANNAKTGGGITIANGIITNAKNLKEVEFLVLVPYDFYVPQGLSDNIEIIKLPRIFSLTAVSPFFYRYYLGRLIKKFKVDGVINLGDLVIDTDIEQVYVFDWPYAVYNEPAVWDSLSFKSKLMQSIKKYLVSKSLNLNNNLHIVAQTTAISNRLNICYKLDNVTILPVPVEGKSEQKEFVGILPEGIKLLYLSHYYPHKNFEILLELASLFKARKFDGKIVTTISASQSSEAKLFLDSVEVNELGSVICNIGPVAHDQCSDLLNSVDALLMPTLLETYGIPYVEAMKAGIPIFTSDRDFSRAVCQESAIYFDPLDSEDIYSKLVSSINNPDFLEEKVSTYNKLLYALPDWDKYCKILLAKFNSRS